jgi:hypothetical protein
MQYFFATTEDLKVPRLGYPARIISRRPMLEIPCRTNHLVGRGYVIMPVRPRTASRAQARGKQVTQS